MTTAEDKSRSTLGEVAHTLPEALLLVRVDGRVTDLNQAACSLLQLERQQIIGSELAELVSDTSETVLAYLRRCAASGDMTAGHLRLSSGVELRSDGAFIRRPQSGGARCVLLRLRPRQVASTRFRVLTDKIAELRREVSLRKRMESLLDSEREVLQGVSLAEPLDLTLERIVRIAEAHATGGMRASILLLDSDGKRLRHAASPSLPEDYSRLIDGVEIGPEVGSCGAAAHLGEPVVASDIASDPRWEDYREVALTHGLAACWSTPITSRRGHVLGTFAMYYAQAGEPAKEDQRVIAFLSRTASIAIERRLEEARTDQLLASESEARALAEAANRSKDELLAVVSHEVRNPLNAILNWARILRGGGIDEKTQSKAIETIERNAELQAKLINDVLDYARAAAGQLRLERVPVRIGELLQQAVESVRAEAASKPLELSFEDTTKGAVVVGDPARLLQMAGNLLANAVKFTPAGGSVWVNASLRDGMARIQIRDTGPGIEQELLSHVFERFWQADQSVSRRHGGLGLGLALVHQLARSHGGSVAAESDGAGAGATLTLSLPIDETAAAGTQRTQIRRDNSLSVGGLRTLVVEDDDDGREVLQAMLERRGAVVTATGSAEDALRLLQGGSIDIILSDIAMPVLDGYEFMRIWRRRESAAGERATPAIAITAHARQVDRSAAREAGYDLHVAKPIDLNALIDAMLRLTGGSVVGS